MREKETEMNKIRIAMGKCRIVPMGQTTDAWDVLTVQNLLFEPLVRCVEGQAKPALAKSWIILDGGRKWIFSLRDSVFFSDGSTCTMQDVKNAIEIMRSAKDSFGMPGPFSRYLSGVTINVIDSSTLEVISPAPNGDIADFLSEIHIKKQNPNGSDLLGTGPYKVAEIVPDRSILLTKRQNQNGIPSAYQNLEFLIVPDDHERLELLKSNQVQIAFDLEHIEGISFNDNSINWHRSVNTLSVMGFLNCFSSPFNNPEARLALNLAVDVDRLISEVMHGMAIPSMTVVSPFHCGFESDLHPIPYDPERAKEIFGRMEMPDELIIRTPTFMPEKADLIAAFIAEQLTQIHVKVQVDVEHNRPEFARQVGRKEIGHIALFDSSPHSTYRVLSDKISKKQGGLWWQGLDDPNLDQMIDDAHETFDTKEREFKYAGALRYLNQNPAWLYLFHPILVTGCAKTINDIEITHEGLLRFPGAW